MARVACPEELEAWKPEAGQVWDQAMAAHLLRRATFGGDRAAVDKAVAQGLEATVQSLLQFDAEEDRTFRADIEPSLGMAEIESLAGWWLYRMRFARSGLREKLALFWHGHFATSNDKVQDVRAMAKQVFLFLDHAAGSFGDLLHAMTRDPALLIWLDAAKSDAFQPNENLARELFELFALGRGQYSEADVKESARALTGLVVKQGRAVFEMDRHDRGEKAIFGQKGAFDADAVVEACLKHPACGRYLAGRLCTFFLEPEPRSQVVDYLAQGLQDNGFRVGWVLEVIFRSKRFHAPDVRRSLVKSPVELVVGLLQALDARGNFKALSDAAGRMGQNLLRPPSVRGWVGGLGWIDAATLLERHSFPARLMAGHYGPVPKSVSGKDVAGLLDQLLMPDLTAEPRDMLEREAERSAGSAALLQAVVALPEYQLA